MACAFCRRDLPLTQEHLWPQWASRVVRIDEPVSHRQRFASAGECDTVREYRRAPWTVTVGAVCARCNNGWMSRLESETKRIAEGMVRGNPQELPPREQATLAMWAALKVLVAEYTIPAANRAVPESHYAWVYDARHTFELPALPFEVHIAAYVGAPHPAFYDRTSLWVDMSHRTTGAQERFAAYV